MNDNDIHPIMKELTKVTKEMPMPVVTEIKILTNRDAYKILISTMLSLRTKDPTTRDASMRLFEHAGTAEDRDKHPEKYIMTALEREKYTYNIAPLKYNE